MSEMSPLAKFLMLILRNGSKGAVGLVALFIGIFIYQKMTPDYQLAMTRQDWGFLGVLVVMLLGALYLVRAISAEINKSS